VNGVERDTLLDIYDLTGIKVKSAQGNSLEVGNLQSGVYLLKAKSQSKMFIKN